MRRIIKHGRRRFARTADQVLAYDYNRQAGGSHVFLRARIEQAEPPDINRL